MLAALVATAHAESRPHYGGSIEATLLGAPASFDPVQARSHAEITVDGLIYDTLYRFGPDGAAIPHLAAAMPVFDERHTTARIEILKGVQFHDGTTVTAKDVAASIERGRLQQRYALAIVTGVRAEGDAVELSLAAPPADLPMLLALPQLSITKAGKAPGARPVGSGPFAVAEVDLAHHRLALKAFDNHFAGRPYLDHLELRWYDTADGEARRFQTGNAHTSTRGAAAFSGGTPTFVTREIAGPEAVLIYVGTKKDVAFRRALDLALARGGLQSITSGEQVTPTRIPVPGGALDAIGKTGDLDHARDEAKKSPGLASAKLEILVEDTRPDDAAIAERVGLALDKLGVQWSVASVPAAQFRERVTSGKADLWIGQIAEPSSPALWWGAAFAAGGDDWPVAALQTNSLDLAAAQKAFAEREPIIPLMFRSVRLWYRSDVHGIAFDALGRPCFADAFVFGGPVRSRP
ncbi:MAG: ABC transporter substrate-binding protein [Kofleriaceae bacterium]